MSFLRVNVPRFTRRAHQHIYLTSTRTQKCFATQDYGSGQGNPAGENPKAQGKNPREDLEHPGPSSPAQNRSSSSSQQQSSRNPKNNNKPQPKILNESPPADHEAPEDVRKHNEDMKKRADRATAGVRSQKEIENDKVSKEFWKG